MNEDPLVFMKHYKSVIEGPFKWITTFPSLKFIPQTRVDPTQAVIIFDKDVIQLEEFHDSKLLKSVLSYKTRHLTRSLKIQSLHVWTKILGACLSFSFSLNVKPEQRYIIFWADLLRSMIKKNMFTVLTEISMQKLVGQYKAVTEHWVDIVLATLNNIKNPVLRNLPLMLVEGSGVTQGIRDHKDHRKLINDMHCLLHFYAENLKTTKMPFSDIQVYGILI
jgi:hypothetical protein